MVKRMNNLGETKNNSQLEEDTEGEMVDIPMGEMFSYEIKVSADRIAVVIGAEGKTKKSIEDETDSVLDIEKDGTVLISGEDALRLYTAKEIVRAISRGFNPKVAMELLKTDYVLEIISLRDVAGKSHKTMDRLKGRIIGERGKSRKLIENLTGAYISVYGKTVGIIGEVNDVYLAHQAVSMLLQGSMHRTVYKFLEKKQQESHLGITEEMKRKV